MLFDSREWKFHNNCSKIKQWAEKVVKTLQDIQLRATKYNWSDEEERRVVLSNFPYLRFVVVKHFMGSESGLKKKIKTRTWGLFLGLWLLSSRTFMLSSHCIQQWSSDMSGCVYNKCRAEIYMKPHILIVIHSIYQFTSILLLRHVWLFTTTWTAASQASLSITNSLSLHKLMSIESATPSNHLILCRPLLLLLSIFPRNRVFSNESVLCIRWPKYWEFQLQHQSFQWIFRTDFL